MSLDVAAALTIILQLILLEGLLSIDNAAVISAMVAHLPDDKLIPWPKPLHVFHRIPPRFLGTQRDAALKAGLVGAYIGRGATLVLAGLITSIPALRIIGAVYLLYLAINHFANFYHEQQRLSQASSHAEVVGVVRRVKGGFWSVVLGVELADLAFSIDNVIAAVALSNQLWVVMVGVALGILIMRFAATIFIRLIDWEPALEHGAFLLLLAIGSELMLKELLDVHIGEIEQFGTSVGVILLTIAIARSRRLRRTLVVFQPFLVLFAAIQLVISTVISFFTLPFHRG